VAPKFGTSGLRGLVTELTPALVGDHVRAFLSACPVGTGLWVGRDLRASSPGIAAIVIDAALAAGVDVTDCGALPTPALAMAAMQSGAAAVMVTGSHIPADRNGLKFYVPTGEITKADEVAILAHLGQRLTGRTPGRVTLNGDARQRWVARVVDAFAPDVLAALHVGVWSHSSVARDLLVTALQRLGARVTEVGRSDTFIPVDTEAVSPDLRAMLADCVRRHGLDAVVSTDGDADRPLLADAAGDIVPGDVIGQITAAAVGAETVVTPVSANTGVVLGGRFAQVLRTRIGSPFVIAAMAQAGGRVAGYEPNGGFLLGFASNGPAGPLPPLMTRDCLLPLVAVLAEATAAGSVAARVAREPGRFTATDRLEHVATERSAVLLEQLDKEEALATFLGALGEQPDTLDRTDGLRITLKSGRILHMRPSGNAPEFRVYAEAENRAAAAELVQQALARVLASLPC
jgi:phosphomannomutase